MSTLRRVNLLLEDVRQNLEGVDDESIQKIKELLTKLGFKNLFIGRGGGRWIDITFDPPAYQGSKDPAYNIQKGKQLMYRELKKAKLLKKHQDPPGAMLSVLVP
jgi:hypothetical protein